MARFLTTALLFTNLCLISSNCDPSSTSTGKMTFDVVTFNIENIDEPKPETHNRMLLVSREIKDKFPFWNLIGIQESRYKTVSHTNIPAALSVGYAEDENIACPKRHPRTAAGCLARHLGTDNVSTNQGNAVIANELWEFLSIHSVELESTNTIPIGGLMRTVHGARIRHKATGQIIPFFSVQLVPNSGGAARHRIQVSNLVSFVRQIWQPGDLPPIIVGDFNCAGVWQQDIRAVIYSDFYEASEQYTIDLVFVGRPQKWLGSAGVIRPVISSDGQRMSGRDPLGNVSDHYANWVRLEWDTSIGPSMVNMPVEPDWGQLGCFPVSPPVL